MAHKVKKDRAAWSGVFPALLVPFQDDDRYSIDERGMRDYVRRFAGIPGITGVVANGHTGEIQTLFPQERARLTAVIADELKDSGLKIVSGLCCEATLEAIEHARALEAAGADAILLMPPHLWLRFGRDSATAIRYVAGVAASVNIGIIIHQYPAWTKVTYTTDDLVELAKIPNVVAIKDGTREIGTYERNVRALRHAAPDVAVLTCHDEYVLPTLIQGVDGALVGFAGFVPELIVELVATALRGDLLKARELNDKIYVLKQAVYRMGEPSADAHQRMKAAMYLRGLISSPRVRPPLAPLDNAVLDELKRQLASVGMLHATSKAA
jgi:4-hydroxy-tetrahydrodipicolinate synthase